MNEVKPAFDLDAIESVTRTARHYAMSLSDALTDSQFFEARYGALPGYDDEVTTAIMLALVARVREAERERLAKEPI